MGREKILVVIRIKLETATSLSVPFTTLGATRTFPARTLGGDHVDELDNIGMPHLLQNLDLTRHSRRKLTVSLEEQLFDGHLVVIYLVKAAEDATVW